MKESQKSSIISLETCPSKSKEAGLASICEKCPGKANCLKENSEPENTGPFQTRMKAIKHKILILAAKGGVGKSSFSATLAFALNQLGNKVGLVDLDITSPNIPHIMGVPHHAILASPHGWLPAESHSRIKVMSIQYLLQQADDALVWRGPRKSEMVRRLVGDCFWSRLDFLLFDTPPGTSDEHLTLSRLLRGASSFGAVLLTTSHQTSLLNLCKEVDFCRAQNIPILGIVENMSGHICDCCGEFTEPFSAGGGEKLATQFGIRFLGRIPLEEKFSECCANGENILQKYPNSNCSQIFMKMANHLTELLRSHHS